MSIASLSRFVLLGSAVCYVSSVTSLIDAQPNSGFSALTPNQSSPLSARATQSPTPSVNDDAFGSFRSPNANQPATSNQPVAPVGTSTLPISNQQAVTNALSNTFAASTPNTYIAPLNPTQQQNQRSQQQQTQSDASQLSDRIGFTNLLTTASEAIRNASRTSPPPQSQSQSNPNAQQQMLNPITSTYTPIQTSATTTLTPVAASLTRINPQAVAPAQSASGFAANPSASTTASNQSVNASSFNINQVDVAAPAMQQPTQAQQPAQLTPMTAAQQQQAQQQPRMAAQPSVSVNTPTPVSNAATGTTANANVNAALPIATNPLTTVAANRPLNDNDRLQVQYEGMSEPMSLDISRIPHFEQQDNAIRAQYADMNNYSLHLANPQTEGLRENPYPAPSIVSQAPSTTTSAAEEALAEQQQEAAQQLANVQNEPVQQLPVTAVNTNLGANAIRQLPQQQQPNAASAVNVRANNQTVTPPNVSTQQSNANQAPLVVDTPERPNRPTQARSNTNNQA